MSYFIIRLFDKIIFADKAMPLENTKLSFSSESPEAKSWFSKKLVPAIKKVGNTAGKIATVAGKVATIAAVL